MSERCSLHGPGVVITPWFVFSAGAGLHSSHRSPPNTQFLLLSPGMAAFSVFFCDQERCSIQPVRAMDHEHAIAQVRSCVPDLRRVAVVPNELLEGVDPEQLLQEWIQARA
jgi:hypothetical protein